MHYTFVVFIVNHVQISLLHIIICIIRHIVIHCFTSILKMVNEVLHLKCTIINTSISPITIHYILFFSLLILYVGIENILIHSSSRPTCNLWCWYRDSSCQKPPRPLEKGFWKGFPSWGMVSSLNNSNGLIMSVWPLTFLSSEHQGT